MNIAAEAEDFGHPVSAHMLLLYINRLYKKKNKKQYKAKKQRQRRDAARRHTPNAPDGLLLWHVTPFFLPLVLTRILSLSHSCHLFSPRVSPVSVSTAWLLRYLFLDIV